MLRFVSAFVLLVLSFQMAGVEILASHAVDDAHPAPASSAVGFVAAEVFAAGPMLVAAASSGDGCADHDDARGCDCGPNCHCCFACAHHATPALADTALAPSLTRVATPSLEAKTPITSHVSSTDVSPPPKVPKLLA